MFITFSSLPELIGFVLIVGVSVIVSLVGVINLGLLLFSKHTDPGLSCVNRLFDCLTSYRFTAFSILIVGISVVLESLKWQWSSTAFLIASMIVLLNYGIYKRMHAPFK